MIKDMVQLNLPIWQKTFKGAIKKNYPRQCSNLCSFFHIKLHMDNLSSLLFVQCYGRSRSCVSVFGWLEKCLRFIMKGCELWYSQLVRAYKIAQNVSRIFIIFFQ